MPNYDYKCEKCEEIFEVFQSMSDDKLTNCIKNECGGNVKRLLGTGSGVIFKGSGFYQTDNRSKSYSDGASKEKPKEKSKESSSTIKKES